MTSLTLNTPFASIITAYIGPGTGLSAIGALLALGVSFIVTFFAFIWYPIRRLRRKWRARALTPGTDWPGRTPRR